MTDNVTRQAIAAQDRSLPNRVTGRLKRVLDMMVWEAATRADAAKACGMTDHSVRQALKRPHVIRYYNAELGTKRLSMRSKNLDRLEELRDQNENKAAAVKAIQVIEQIPDHEMEAVRGNNAPTQPGLIIFIEQPPSPPQPPIIDVTPSDDDRH